MPESKAERKRIENVAKNIAHGLVQSGPKSVVIIFQEEDWEDIQECINFSLEEEDLLPNERHRLMNINAKITRKLKIFRRRTQEDGDSLG